MTTPFPCWEPCNGSQLRQKERLNWPFSPSLPGEVRSLTALCLLPSWSLCLKFSLGTQWLTPHLCVRLCWPLESDPPRACHQSPPAAPALWEPGSASALSTGSITQGHPCRRWERREWTSAGFLLFFFTFIYYVCICVGMCTPVRVEVKGQLADIIVPLCHVGLEIELRVSGSKHLCSLDHIAGSRSLTH